MGDILEKSSLFLYYCDDSLGPVWLVWVAASFGGAGGDGGEHSNTWALCAQPLLEL